MHKITFDKETHSYYVDGQPVPSVSSLLVEVGMIDQNVIKYANTELGSAVHRACELDDMEILDEETCHPEVMIRLCHWREFKLRYDTEIILNEKPLYSKAGFCGTPDRLMKIDGKYVLIDIKTSKKRSKSTKVQLAFYKKMVEENLGIVIDEVWEIVLDGEYHEPVKHNHLEAETRITKSMLAIHYYKKEK